MGSLNTARAVGQVSVWMAVACLCLSGCVEKPDLNELEVAVVENQLDPRAVRVCDETISFVSPAPKVAAIDATAGEIRALRDEVDVYASDYDLGLPSEDSTYAAICIYEYNPFPDEDFTYEADWVSHDSNSGGQGIIAFW